MTELSSNDMKNLSVLFEILSLWFLKHFPRPTMFYLVMKLEETKWLITNGQTAIVDAYNWNSHAREVYYFP